MWILYTPLGLILALVGYWGPWVNHKTAALVLSGLDMAEFVPLLPEVQAGAEFMISELFYLPLLTVALCLALMGTSQHLCYPLWARVLLLAIAILLVVIVLPPYPFILRALGVSEFRRRFLAGAGCLAALVALLLYRRLPKTVVAGLLVLVPIVGAVLPLWQFFSISDALDRVYGQPINIGWGLWLTTAGFLVVAGTGTWVFVNQWVTRELGNR